jgi:hypothetical protein
MVSGISSRLLPGQFSSGVPLAPSSHLLRGYLPFRGANSCWPH